MDLEKLGRNIKKIRELRDYDQKYMSEQLAISTSHYCRIEQGIREIGVRQLKKIARLLQVEWSVLEKFDVEECLSVFQNKQQKTSNYNPENKKSAGYTLHFDTENSPQKAVSINRYYRHYFLSLIRLQNLICYSPQA